MGEERESHLMFEAPEVFDGQRSLSDKCKESFVAHLHVNGKAIGAGNRRLRVDTGDETNQTADAGRRWTTAVDDVAKNAGDEANQTEYVGRQRTTPVDGRRLMKTDDDARRLRGIRDRTLQQTTTDDDLEAYHTEL